MLKLTRQILTYLALGLLLTACSMADEPDQDGFCVPDGYVLMHLRLRQPSETRAGDPTGGENGDGRLHGFDNENAVNNVNIFFYSSEKGLDRADDTTPINFSVYLNVKDMQDTVSTYPIEKEYLPVLIPIANKPKDGDRIIVVCNAGDLTKANLKTVGQVADYQIAQTWTANSDKVADCSNFVMSNTYQTDGVVSVGSHKGTKEDPFSASVTVERLASRIEIIMTYATHYAPSNDAPALSTSDYFRSRGDLMYSLENQRDAYVAFEKIMIFQSPVAGTYTIKHLTDNLTDFDNLFLNIDEKTEKINYSSGYEILPTNYVVDPRTLLKDNLEEATSYLTSWFNEKRTVGYLKDNYKEAFNELDSLRKTYLIYHYNSSPNERVAGYIIGYANENTQKMDRHLSQYMTGLLIQARYMPSWNQYVKAYDATSDKITVWGEPEGVRPYSPEYRKAQEEYIAHIFGRTFWRYVQNKGEDEQYAYYFENESDLKAYMGRHPSSNAKVEKFENGKCYYTIWIKHAYNNYGMAGSTIPVRETNALKYGIVRNNVYQIKVAVYNPGSAVPVLEDPDYYDANFEIWVRNWNFKRLEQIIL